MVIVSAESGRLANRLVTFAHLAAAGREHGYRVWNPAFGEYARFFPALEGDALCRFPPRPAPRAHPRLRPAAFQLARRAAGASVRLGRPIPVVRLDSGEEVDVGGAEFVRRARRGPLLVQGWLFRDERSLALHGDEIRAFLRPHDRHVAAAEEACARARGDADVLVGVHVRRGDYRRWRGGRYFWEAETYADLMSGSAALFPGRRVSFLVCSDEPMPSLPGTPGPGHVLEDLYALAGCDYVLGPPSTYSGWASFYGRVPLAVVEDPATPLSLESFAVA